MQKAMPFTWGIYVWCLDFVVATIFYSETIGSSGTVAGFSYYALFICAYKYGLTNYFMNIIEQSPLNVAVIVVEDDDDISSFDDTIQYLANEIGLICITLKK